MMPAAEPDGRSPGLELIREIVRAQAAAHSCPECGQPLREIEIEVGEVTVDRVMLDVTCCSCGTSFHATVAPAGDGGVAIVQ